MDHCDECGYSYDSLPRGELAPTIRSFGPRYTDLLERPEEDLRAHPLRNLWSALEYACHIRDVFRAQRQRVQLALDTDEPTFPSMRREERVVEERYNEQSPRQVAREIWEAAEAFAAAIDALDEGGWQRTGIYSWPNASPRTLDWVARHTVHEGKHHVMDIERLLAALS